MDHSGGQGGHGRHSFGVLHNCCRCEWRWKLLTSYPQSSWSLSASSSPFNQETRWGGRWWLARLCDIKTRKHQSFIYLFLNMHIDIIRQLRISPWTPSNYNFLKRKTFSAKQNLVWFKFVSTSFIAAFWSNAVRLVPSPYGTEVAEIHPSLYGN